MCLLMFCVKSFKPRWMTEEKHITSWRLWAHRNKWAAPPELFPRFTLLCETVNVKAPDHPSSTRTHEQEPHCFYVADGEYPPWPSSPNNPPPGRHESYLLTMPSAMEPGKELAIFAFPEAVADLTAFEGPIVWDPVFCWLDTQSNQRHCVTSPVTQVQEWMDPSPVQAVAEEEHLACLYTLNHQCPKILCVFKSFTERP